MTATEQQPDLFWQTAVLADLRRFAALPDWLIAATRPAVVVPALTQTIPECTRGDLTIAACKIGGLRLSTDEPTWTGAYQLTLVSTTTGERTTIDLVGRLVPPGERALDRVVPAIAFGSAGWRCAVPALHLELAVPPSADRLPALPQLTDPLTARALLERSLRDSAPRYQDVIIAACQPEVLRDHPGLRATLRYHLSYPIDLVAARDWPGILIAKTYVDEQGQHAYDGMRALWQSPLAADPHVLIAEPIAYLPDHQVLIQGPVAGEQSLAALIGAALMAPSPAALVALDTVMRRTAHALAALHRTPIESGELYGWADELAVVGAFADRVAARVPELVGAATALLATLDASAAITGPDPAVFAHGTFRPNQVLLEHAQVGLIDFDSWCQAEPAVDLALFLSSVRDVGLGAISKAARSRADDPAGDELLAAMADQLDSICATFLTEYARLMPITPARVWLWETLFLFNLVLRSWERVKPIRLANTLRLLERHIHRLHA